MALLISIIIIKNHKIKILYNKLLQFGKPDYLKTKIKCSGCHKTKHRQMFEDKNTPILPANELAKPKFVIKIAVLTEEILESIMSCSNRTTGNFGQNLAIID